MPAPSVRLAVHSVVDPVATVAVPVGIPAFSGLTVTL